MADLPRLHAQATRLILLLREGLERLEGAEVRACCRPRRPRPLHQQPQPPLGACGRCVVLTAAVTALLPHRAQHGLRPGDPSIIARDLQQKLSELQVSAESERRRRPQP